MDFTLTDEQQMLIDTGRQLFAEQCDGVLARAAWEDPAVGVGLWDRHLFEWMELAGGDVIDLVLFAESHGRAVAPGPFLSSILARQVSDAVGIGPAEGAVTLAIAGSAGEWVPNEDVVKTHVTDAGIVSAIVVVSGSPAEPLVGLVDVGACELREVDQFDRLRRQFEVTVPASAGVSVDPAALVHGLERATLIVASELIGVGRWCLDASVAYARERVQFGQPIGAFQGLQWKLVDAALVLETAAAMVAYVSMAVDADDPDRHRAVHAAKAEAGRAARRCVRDGLQVHGGIGYTWEHELPHRFRRAYAADALFGPSGWHLDRLAGLLLD